MTHVKSYYRLFFAVIIVIGFVSIIPYRLTAQFPPAFKHSSPPLHGRVVAAESGLPVVGASILAFWNSEGTGLFDAQHVLEAVTQSDGTFVLEGWTSSSLRSPVSKHSPTIVCFAPGYDVESLYLGDMNSAGVQQIRLRKFDGSAVTRAQNLAQLAGQLGMLAAALPGNPIFQMIPAIEAEWQRLPASARKDSKVSSLIIVFEGVRQEGRAAYDEWRLQSGAMPKGTPTTPVPPPQTYAAEETRARIVDEGTGEPIEGAVVVAQWILAVISGRGPTMHIAEAVTDKIGEFVIPAWGPKPRRPLTELTYKSPQLLIFKHGYQPLWLQNESLKAVAEYFPNYKNMTTKDLSKGTSWFKGSPLDPVQKSMWTGLNIQIEKFNGTSDRWLSSLENLLSFIAEQDDKEVPRFFDAYAAELEYFKVNPVTKQKQAQLYSLSDRIKRARK